MCFVFLKHEIHAVFPSLPGVLSPPRRHTGSHASGSRVCKNHGQKSYAAGLECQERQEEAMNEDEWVNAINAAEPSLSDLEDLESLLIASNLPESVKARLLSWVGKLIGRAKARAKDEQEENREKSIGIKHPRG